MDRRGAPERPAIASELPLRPQDETDCRRCSVYCDKVVYAYEEWGRTYVGCMQKVFDVEIDLTILTEAQGRRGGFGAVRAKRQPLPMCRAEVSRCYENREDELGC